MPDRPLPDLRDAAIHATSLAQGADLCGLSYHAFYRAVKRGAVPTVTIPGTRRILIPAWWLREQLGITLADSTHVSA